MRVELGWGTPSDVPERLTQLALRSAEPMLPELTQPAVRRWEHLPTWMPPETTVLSRHRQIGGHRRLHLQRRDSPPGFEREWDIGFVHRQGLVGTRRLDERDGRYSLHRDADVVDDDTVVLGYVEQAPLPLLDVLERRRLPETGQEVLVAGSEDPLGAVTDPLGVLGWIEAFPIQPRRAPEPQALRAYDVLVRAADRTAWRHAYATGDAGAGSESVPLGAVLRRPGSGYVALHQTGDGKLWTELSPRGRSGRHLREVARWTGAPLAWQGCLSLSTVRASASRARHAVQMTTARGGAGDDGVLGWLRREPAPGWSPLFLGVHPALGDHFATRSELEALDLGYRIAGVLGHIADAGASRAAHEQPHEVLWGSRFGHGRRYAEGPATRPRDA